ncbi:nephrocystin-3-like [Xenia sp. Carnegie-2017]|uniref:nephrocystin-3-like n=1 Tax=Xenia sp. Carnegie-2017 TaxID=2897299 RepID=UPI001F044DC9|nr:nephrocystin-3-like [Xenia sp. Carnegie-2017]
METENCAQLGDRLEVTRRLPVESFGQDNSIVLNDSSVKTRSSTSLSEAKGKSRSSLQSLSSFFGFKHKGDDQSHNDNANHTGSMSSAELAEIKISRLTKKNNDLQQKHERLNRELHILRQNYTKYREESVLARTEEKQAKERAKTFENELDKMKKEFKSYTNDKEKEIHSLVKRVNQLEKGLENGGNDECFEIPSSSTCDEKFEKDNLSLFKASEFLIREKVPDFNVVYPLLSQVGKKQGIPSKAKVYRIYFSTDKLAKRDATLFSKVVFPELRQRCAENGKFLVVFESTCDHGQMEEEWEYYLMKKCDLFFGIFAKTDNRAILDRWKRSLDVFNAKKLPVVFAFKDARKKSYGGTELTHFLDGLGENTKVSFYSHVTTLVEENKEDLQDIIKEHFGLASESSMKDHMTYILDVSDEELFTDCESCLKQLEILHLYTKSSAAYIGLDKYYKQLDSYVNSAGSCPPLVVSGDAGCGKSTLLANWVQRQLDNGNDLILYNFASATNCDVFTNPAHIMRRIVSQLLGLYPCLCSLMHCDPVKCEELFPWMLKTIPEKIDRKIIIVIDAVDTLKNSSTTHHLSWLVDSLPETVRVVLSVNTDNVPSEWRLSRSLRVLPWTHEESKEYLVSCWKNSEENAIMILKNLSDFVVCSPLFLKILGHELTRVSDLAVYIHEQASVKNVAELITHILTSLESTKGALMKQVLALICSSRSGLTEVELMEVLSLTWLEISPIMKYLLHDRPILCEVNDLLVIPNSQLLEAVLLYLNSDIILKKCRQRLVQYYSDKLTNNGVSESIIDQLPWLLQQLDDKENLRNIISRIDVFHMFVKRSLFSDLLSYWSYLDTPNKEFALVYMDAIKKMEDDASCLEVALRYEVLGRFLKGVSVKLHSMAMKCLERALEMKEFVLETNDSWIAQSLHYLGDLYLLLGNLESAEASYKQTLDINESTYGKGHLLIAKELDCLAFVKIKQKKQRACLELQCKSSKIRKKAYLRKKSTSNPGNTSSSSPPSSNSQCPQDNSELTVSSFASSLSWSDG